MAQLGKTLILVSHMSIFITLRIEAVETGFILTHSFFVLFSQNYLFIHVSILFILTLLPDSRKGMENMQMNPV